MAKTKLGELEQLWRKISGALKSAIDAHGPITELLITSTTKRIVGSINAPEEQAEIMRELAEIDELRHALDARDERIRELERTNERLERWKKLIEDSPGEAKEVARIRCLEADYMQPIINEWRKRVESLEQQLKAAQEPVTTISLLLRLFNEVDTPELREICGEDEFIRHMRRIYSRIRRSLDCDVALAVLLERAVEDTANEYFAKHFPEKKS